MSPAGGGQLVRAESSGAILGAYLPQDRRERLSGAGAIAERAVGSVLFADVSGFTRLTNRLTERLGRRRGAEEVPRYLNRLYDALISEVELRGGSVIGFAGDAITCWLDGDSGAEAVACALAMQGAMADFKEIRLGGDPAEEPISLHVKISVTHGTVRRFVVGDPAVQLLDVIAGDTVARLEPLNGLANPGEIVVDEPTAAALGRGLELATRNAPGAPPAYVVIGYDTMGVRPGGLPPYPTAPAVERLTPWLLPTVKRRLEEGQGEFLTELRPVAALFMSFSGIDYDHDPQAPEKLDMLVRWVQGEAGAVGANLLQLTVGDKGSYLYVACGAPVSHGDDAHRCAAAAIRLRQVQKTFGFLENVQLGLGYGTARTGAYGAISRRTYGALGIETNMAARLMSIAESGRAYASEAFASACRDAFTFSALPARLFKGGSGPVPVYELVAHVGAATLTADDDGAKRLIGRDEELAVLTEALMSARLGRGTMVQLTAAAGIGKSRLLAAALPAAAGHDLEVLRGAGQAYAGASPYRAWSSVIHAVLGLDPQAPPQSRRVDLTAALNRIDPALNHRAPLLSPVLDLQLDDTILVASMSPEIRQASREDLLLTLLRRRAEQLAALGITMVIVIEDLHALDPLSRELLEAFARLVPDLPVALFTAGRPQLAEQRGQSQSGGPLYLLGATQLLLGPLRPAESEQLLAERLRGTTFHPDQRLLAELLDRAEGNPYFLETLLSEVIARDDVGRSSSDQGLPTNLHSLVLARLDHLSERQQAMLKVASAIGREFPAQWVQACLGRSSAAETIEELEALRRIDLTPLVSRDPLVYRFDHSITRDVTYESLPLELQRELHTRLARFIEQKVASPQDQHLDLLAFHYERSKDDEKRRYYLWRAGRAAQENYAHEAADDYYQRLLPLLEGSARLEPLLALGEVRGFIGDTEAAEVSLREALATAQAAADRPGVARAQRLLGELLERRGEHEQARSWLEKAVRTSRELDDGSELTKVLLALGGNALWHLGSYPEATQMLLEALALAGEAGDDIARARALHGLGNIDLYRGDTAEAERRYRESLEIRRQCGDELGVANSLNNLGIVAANAERKAEAEESFRQSLAIRRRLGDVSGVAVALNNLGFMAAEDGKLDEAKQMFEQSLTLRREIGDELGNAVCLNNLADVARRQDDGAGARRLYRESLELSHRIGNQREAATAMVGLAATTAEQDVALRLATCAETLMASLGATLDREVKTALDQVLAGAVTTLGLPAVESARATASRLTFEAMTTRALASTAS